MRLLLAVMVLSCGKSARDEQAEKLDRMIEEAGGLYRDTENRSFKVSGGKAVYADARGGEVPAAMLPPGFRMPEPFRPPPPAAALPLQPTPVETDVTRGEDAEAMGDHGKAAALYKAACTAKTAGGCAHLALLLKDGKSVPKDTKRAEDLARTACDGDDGYGCFALGIIYETVSTKTGFRPVADVIASYDKGCTLKNPDACNALGMLYHAGRGVPKAKDKAVAALQRGCDLGDRMSCNQIGMVKR